MSLSNNFTSTHEINTSKKNGTTNFHNSENVKIIIRVMINIYYIIETNVLLLINDFRI